MSPSRWKISEALPPRSTNSLLLLDTHIHPRLLFGNADVSTLRRSAATTHEAIWLPILEYARTQLRTKPPPFTPSGDLEFYRDSGNELIALAFTCLITDRSDFCSLAKSYLLEYAGWSQWGEHGWRDLGHAHMLVGSTLAYDWIYSTLDTNEREVVQRPSPEWAQKMYEASSAQSSQDSLEQLVAPILSSEPFLDQQQRLGFGWTGLVREDTPRPDLD